MIRCVAVNVGYKVIQWLDCDFSYDKWSNIEHYHMTSTTGYINEIVTSHNLGVWMWV